MPLPKGEHAFTGYYNRDGILLFVITAKAARDYYYLYEVKDEVYKKLGRSKNPLELVEKYHVMERMRE